MKKILFIATMLSIFGCEKSKKSPSPGTKTKKYYRIKQVDKDGKIKYHPYVVPVERNQ